MKKQTLHSIKLLSLAIFAAITLIIGISFSVSAQQLKPVLKDRLVKVLQDKSLSKEQITSIIKKNGVDFQLTGAVETELRNAGADDTVIEAARNNYRGEALLTDNQTDTTSTNQTSNNYKVGDTIEVQSYSTWFKAKILEIKDGSYKINFDGYGNGLDEWVKPDRMRSVGKTAPANKQTNTTTANTTNNKYKVGDRVEINHNGHYNPVWVKGTIVSIYTIDNGEQAGFEVRVDDVKDYTGAGQVYKFQAQAVRPLNETAEEKQAQLAKQAAADKAVVKLRLDENNKILADRELLDCDNLGIKPVKNGARPTLETTGKVIRCHHEKKGNAETVTIDITSFQIGAPTKWRLLREVGPDANLSTIVHPIKTTFTQKNYTRAVVYTKVIETIYSCYVNTFGDWRCFNGAFKEKGETKRTPVQQ